MLSRHRTPAARVASLAAAVVLAGCSAVTTQSADRFEETGELIALSGGEAGAAQACFTCHGLDGRGNGAGTPRLAGLNLGYLERQLEAYADGRRSHAMMSLIARKLTPESRKAVAAYYAQVPYRAADAAPPAPAPALYHRGDAARGLVACASCHGERGEGLGAANPPLGGQPAGYLAEQLERWRTAQRRNDPGDVMLKISRELTTAESAALSAYAARLPGDRPSPEPPAAFRATRRDDPRNGA